MKAHTSFSALKHLYNSPNKYRYYEEHPPEATPAGIFGKAYHVLTLQEAMFENTYAVEPKFDKRTKQGKEDAEIWLATNPGKEIITQVQHDTLIAMREVLHRNKTAMRLLQQSPQREVEFMQVIDGMPVKGFVDALGTRRIIELKTVTSACPSDFEKTVANQYYHLQAAIYSEVYQLPYIWIAQETSTPNEVCICEATESIIKQGRYELSVLLKLLKHCKDNDYWPDNSVWAHNRAGIHHITLPGWAYKTLDYNH